MQYSSFVCPDEPFTAKEVTPLDSISAIDAILMLLTCTRPSSEHPEGAVIDDVML